MTRLKKLGHDVQLEKGDGYFIFRGGEAANWLDTTVKAPTLSRLTLEQWMDEFNRLKKLNQEILRGHGASDAPTPRPGRKK
jgi:hypothetical protein